MTNMHLALITSLVSLAAGGVGFYFLRAHITSEFNRLETALQTRLDGVETNTKAHVASETEYLRNFVGRHVTELQYRVADGAEKVTDFIAEHADSLEKHAAEIKAHSLELHDRAVSRDIAPREAVKRT